MGRKVQHGSLVATTHRLFLNLEDNDFSLVQKKSVLRTLHR